MGLRFARNAWRSSRRFPRGRGSSGALPSPRIPTNLTPPCGACRQILWEFCGDIEVVLVNPQGKTEICRMGALFPRPFDASFI